MFVGIVLPTRGRIAACALTLVGIMLLTACSSATINESASSVIPDSTAGEKQDTADSANDPARITTATQWGPLDAIRFRITGFHPNATAEERTALESTTQRAQEEMIAACMAEQGFEYIPHLLAPQRIHLSDESIPSPDSREFAEQFGFGLSINPPDNEIIVSDPSLDPNDELRAAMSPTHLAAWELALWGAQEEGNWNSNQIGCFEMASQATRGIPDEFSALLSEIDIFFAGVELVPAVVELNTEWVACMASEGFSHLQSPDLLQASLFVEWYGLQGFPLEKIVNEDGLTSIRFSGGNGVAASPDQLSEFSKREMLLALSNYDCRHRMSYDQRHSEISAALQQDFTERHRYELEALVSHIERRTTSRK